MAKGRGTRGPYIKNGNLIGKGDKIPLVKDTSGNTKWVNSVEKSRAKPTPATKPDIKNILKSTTNLTTPSRVAKAANSPKVTKGATELIASQKNVKPAIKPPAPAKKPPTPGR